MEEEDLDIEDVVALEDEDESPPVQGTVTSAMLLLVFVSGVKVSTYARTTLNPSQLTLGGFSAMRNVRETPAATENGVQAILPRPSFWEQEASDD